MPTLAEKDMGGDLQHDETRQPLPHWNPNPAMISKARKDWAQRGVAGVGWHFLCRAYHMHCLASKPTGRANATRHP